MRFEMCEIKPLGQRGHTPPVFRHSTVQNASWRYPESPGSSKSAPRRKGACTAASRRVRDLQIGRFWPQVWGGRGVTTAFLFCVLPGDVRRLGRKYGTRRRPTPGPHRLRTAPVDCQPKQYCLRTVSGRRRRRRQHLPHPRVGLFAIELALVRLHQRAHDLQDTRTSTSSSTSRIEVVGTQVWT